MAAEAIECYSYALSEVPTSPDYYLKRSMAHHKSKEYSKALSDSEQSVAHAYNRGKKELRTLAQFRRGLALIALERYAEAKSCLELAVRDGLKDNSLPFWQSKIDRGLENCPSRVAPEIKEIPDVRTDVPSDTTKDTITADCGTSGTALEGTPSAAANTESRPTLASGPAIPAKSPNFDWYQNDQDVIISFYVSNIPQDKVQVEIEAKRVNLAIKMDATGSEFIHDFDPLWSEIVPAASAYRVLRSKIEITLRKLASGRWTSIDRIEEPTSKPPRMSYPTSSKHGPKNWEKLGNQEAEAKGEGDEALTQLFQSIYKDADDNTRRAMVKSFTESGGTNLSTDWKSVGAKPVEISPPEGMEARKWN